MNRQEQLKQYKSELEEIFFSRKYSGDVATLIKKDIIRVSKLITPEKIKVDHEHRQWEEDNLPFR